MLCIYMIVAAVLSATPPKTELRAPSISKPPWMLTTNEETAKLHCANPDGAFIGLASDASYTVRLPSGAPQNPEKWTVVNEATVQAEHNHVAASNSFTGTYVVVLPDDKDSYREVFGAGSFTMSGLDFAFSVSKPGRHSLFLRWTGGDDFGGGDSLYVVMRKADTDALVGGTHAYKPKLVPMEEAEGVTGCCYEPTTHACPCAAANASCIDSGGRWVSKARASHWKPLCDEGRGELVEIASPLWYLYAGQLAGNVMDFASEPWDATCEAEGKGTADTGLDVASWELDVGIYRLVVYPREDGTAVDAFYLKGPGGATPDPQIKLVPGSSTTDCSGEPPALLAAAMQQPAADGASGGGIEHRQGDAGGWGSRSAGMGYMRGGDPTAPAGKACGVCLVPIDKSECPTAEVLNAMKSCDSTVEGEMCEADGECGTNVHVNNCDNDSSDPSLDAEQDFGQGYGRSRRNRNNDVYRHVPEGSPGCGGGGGGGGGGGVTAVVVILVLLAICGGVFVFWRRKGGKCPAALPWAIVGRSTSRSASDYLRNADSASNNTPLSGTFVPPSLVTPSPL